MKDDFCEQYRKIFGYEKKNFTISIFHRIEKTYLDLENLQKQFELCTAIKNYLTFLDFLNHLVNTFLALFRKVLTSENFLGHL